MSRLLPGAAGLVVPMCILTKTHRIQVQNGFDTLILDATPFLSILHAPTHMLCKLPTGPGHKLPTNIHTCTHHHFLLSFLLNLNPLQARKTQSCCAGGAATVLCPQPEGCPLLCPPAAGSPLRTPLPWHRSSGPRWSRRSRSRSWMVCGAWGWCVGHGGVGDSVWGTGMVCRARGCVWGAGAWGQASEQLQVNLTFKATSWCSSLHVAQEKQHVMSKRESWCFPHHLCKQLDLFVLIPACCFFLRIPKFRRISAINSLLRSTR